MAFWLVYQGNTWKRAREGGYLWAPKRGTNDQPLTYWSNMARVQPGDLIFAGVNGALRAIAEAPALAYTAMRPDPRDDQYWYGEGWRLDVAYADLPSPMVYKDWVPQVLAEMPSKHSAFDKNGGPNQGYLYELPNSVGEYIAERARSQGVDIAGRASAAAPVPPGGDTQRQILSTARIGQGKFRADLLNRWNGRCAVSAVEHPSLLRASHIKPWSSSNNAERLDPDNGLLLSAAYDAAFDALLVSFDADGSLLLAPDFPEAAAEAAGIRLSARLLGIGEATQRYLQDHRSLMQSRAGRVSD